jgi:predicted GNAT family acetyltransferase
MTALRGSVRGYRLLDDADLAPVRRLLDRDPYVNAVISARLDAAGSIVPRLLGGELAGVEDPEEPGSIESLCFSGGNLLPAGGRPATWEQLGVYLGERRRTCTSVTGRAEAIEVLWPTLARYWGPARLMRPNQPLLVVDHAAGVAPDPDVRAATIDDLERYIPAATAMFAEELLIDPFGGSARTSLRSRLAELIGGGRAFVRLDRRGQVAFKAEIGAVSRATCQIQGVWVRPDLRGRGLATAAVSAVVEAGLRLAPTVSLYVNDFNLPARAVYDRLGMTQVATLSTVMF